eukprot:1317826-Amphidinium_carterae.2
MGRRAAKLKLKFDITAATAHTQFRIAPPPLVRCPIQLAFNRLLKASVEEIEDTRGKHRIATLPAPSLISTSQTHNDSNATEP